MPGKNKNRRPEGIICEQFAYLPKLSFYANGSDMKKLGIIGGDGLQEILARII